MSLYDVRGLFATDKEMARRRSRSCVEGHCAVSHKKHWSACRRNNQCFPKELQQNKQVAQINT